MYSLDPFSETSTSMVPASTSLGKSPDTTPCAVHTVRSVAVDRTYRHMNRQRIRQFHRMAKTKRMFSVECGRCHEGVSGLGVNGEAKHGISFLSVIVSRHTLNMVDIYTVSPPPYHINIIYHLSHQYHIISPVSPPPCAAPAATSSGGGTLPPAAPRCCYSPSLWSRRRTFGCKRGIVDICRGMDEISIYGFVQRTTHTTSRKVPTL